MTAMALMVETVRYRDCNSNEGVIESQFICQPKNSNSTSPRPPPLPPSQCQGIGLITNLHYQHQRKPHVCQQRNDVHLLRIVQIKMLRINFIDDCHNRISHSNCGQYHSTISIIMFTRYCDGGFDENKDEPATCTQLLPICLLLFCLWNIAWNSEYWLALVHYLL